jgi:hypothetical protein
MEQGGWVVVDTTCALANGNELTVNDVFSLDVNPYVDDGSVVMKSESITTYPKRIYEPWENITY